MIFQTKKFFQLIGLLYCWYHYQILQIWLKDVLAVDYKVWALRWWLSWRPCSTSWERHNLIRAYWATSFEFHEILLHKLAAALRKLDTWVLVDQALMELAESFVLLGDWPSPLVVKTDSYEIFGVSPVVYRVIRDDGVLDLALKAHLEEVCPAKVAEVLWASLDVLKEDACGMESVAELALRGHAVLESPGYGL